MSIYSLLVLNTRRIVFVGKTGAGKSSLGNTILEDTVFKINSSPNSETRSCQAVSKHVNGRSITLIDTPGLFDTTMPEEQLKPEILRCITECAPGPHAFLIVLKLEKYTEQEGDVVNKINKYFSEEALRYAAVVFTHGDQLPEGMKIQDFVNQSKGLSDLVEKCGGRCHVIDNKYWKNNQQNPYRSNQFQVAELLNTVDKIVKDNNGDYYTNEMLQAAEREIQKEEEKVIRKSSGNITKEEARKQAKMSVCKSFLIKFAGVTTGALVGGLFGEIALVAFLATKPVEAFQAVKMYEGATGTKPGFVLAALGGTGAIMGGLIGYDAAKGAETPSEACTKAVEAICDKATATYRKIKGALKEGSSQNQNHTEQ